MSPEFFCDMPPYERLEDQPKNLLEKQSENPSEKLCEQLEQLMRSLQSLQTSLQQIATSDDAANPGAIGIASQSVAQQSTNLLPQFLEILDTLGSADIAPKAEQRIRPFQTEAHRRLRLIKTEAMRLRTVKKQATLKKSQTQLLEHLNALQQFAAAIAQEVCADSSTL